MFCRYCGEENLEEAVYCKNCGKKLKEDVKTAEIIETPVVNQNNNNQQNNTQSTTTTSSSSNTGDSDWLSCCLCLIGIFIIFAIIGSL